MPATLSKVAATIFFLKKDPKHEKEKPYAFRYAADINIPKTNFELKEYNNVMIEDIRDRLWSFTIEQNGFCVLELSNEIHYEDYFDFTKVETYFHQLESLLKDHLQALSVNVFRHAIRKRDPEFPVSSGRPYEFDQPTSVAHIDTTREETVRLIRRIYGSEADEWLQNRFQWINIWKPLRGPLSDWPLAVCDSSSINPLCCLEKADLLYPEFVTENCQVYHNFKYQWYFLSKQQTNELLVFKQSDSDPKASPGVPHASFYNPYVPSNESPRESIEARALVFY